MVSVPTRAGEHGLQCQFRRAHPLRCRHSGVAARDFRRWSIAILSLRTTFSVRSGKPAQQVHQQLSVHFVETDASAWDSEVLKTRLLEEAYRPFDLERGPPLRVNLFTRSAQEHVLLLVVHHIVIDFWSLAVLLTSSACCIRRKKQAYKASLPALDSQYATMFVGRPKCWRAPKVSGYGPTGRSNWPDSCRCWIFRPIGRDRRFRHISGASYDFHLNDELSWRLKALAKAQGATLYMVLLAAFQVILHYHTGQEDLLVGSPMLGRSRAEFEGIVGLFTNPVILRANFPEIRPSRRFLARCAKPCWPLWSIRIIPTMLLVERLRPARDLSRPPLCQVMFVLDKPHRLAEQGTPAFVLGDTGLRMNLGGLELEALTPGTSGSHSRSGHVDHRNGKSLSFSIRYNSELFDAATIARIAKHFETLLRHIAAQSNSSLNALKDMLAEDDGSNRRNPSTIQRSRPPKTEEPSSGWPVNVSATEQ